jgi:glycosyltransferase involved in cell wall biosynthesis
MASEMPVIASNSGGIPEVVTHGEVGYLTEVGDVDAMTAYAIELGLSEELRARMGRAGRARAETVFPASKAADEYEAVYREAIGAEP